MYRNSGRGGLGVYAEWSWNDIGPLGNLGGITYYSPSSPGYVYYILHTLLIHI
jgi:hypothetical protein